MSRWPGRLITKTPVTPGGSSPTASAPGVWTLPEMAYWKKRGLWPDASADAYWGYVSYLMATSSLSNASNNLFVDSSGAFNPIARVGNTNQGAITPYGTFWSNYFDGSGDYLTVPYSTAFDLSGSSWTMEAWFYSGSFASAQTIISKDTYGSNYDWGIAITNSTTIVVYTAGTASNLTATVPTMTPNTWYHVAVVRNSGVNSIYLNGVSYASNSMAITNNSQSFVTIGCSGWNNPNSFFPGYISNLRIVKGTAVYTSAFTPPAAPLTAVSGTSLLTCQSNRFRDASSNAFAITVNGDTKVTPFSPFVLSAPGAVYNQSDISYWSGYFNGSSYLSAPDSSGYALNSTGWSFETFVNFTSLPASGGAASLAAQWYDGDLGWWFYLYNNAGTYQLYFSYSTNGSSQTNISVNLSAAPPLNTWNHIAYLYLSGIGVGIFWNGVQIGTFQSFGGTVFNSSSAMQIGARVGSAGAGYYLNGYLSNMRLVNAPGGSYSWPPTAPITAISGTTLLTLQSAAFTDNSTTNAVFTPVGSPAVTGNNPFQSGYYSNYFDGSGDGLSISNYSSSALAFGTGDFTIEFWAFATTAPNNNWTPFFTMGTSGGGQEIRVSQNVNGGGFGWLYPNNTNNGDVYSGYGAMTTNTWHHIAMTRSGSTMRLFLDGAVVATGTGVSFNFTNTTVLRIGLPQPAYPDGAFTGYLSNLRIVKGTAVYTAAFTPPTAPLTAISGTGLLTCQANRLIDSSSNAFALTKVGDTSVSPFDPFYTATVASNGGSMYFDGNGDYLSLVGTPLFSIATSTTPFTIEGWLYPTAAGGVIFNEAYTGSGNTIPIAITMATNANSMDPTGGRYIAFGAYNGSAWTVAAYSSSQIQLNTWTHVACVFTGSTTKIFFNGVDVTAGTPATTWPVTGVAGDGWYVGRRWDTYADVYFSGYISDFRFTNGTAVYTTAFTPPTAPLTPSGNTVLLLNGMNAGTYDAGMQNNLETVGTAQITSAQAKYGTTSVRFNGNPDYLIMPSGPQFVFGTGDFTVEGWVYVISQSTFIILYDSRPTSTSGIYPVVFISASGYLGYSVNNSDVIVGSTTMTTGTWHHFAVARSGTSTKLFLNGVQQGSTYTDTNNYLNGPSRPIIASNGFGPGNSGLNGYIDDLRVTKGVARYTSNFTPPTQAFPPY